LEEIFHLRSRQLVESEQSQVLLSKIFMLRIYANIACNYYGNLGTPKEAAKEKLIV